MPCTLLHFVHVVCPHGVQKALYAAHRGAHAAGALTYALCACASVRLVLRARAGNGCKLRREFPGAAELSDNTKDMQAQQCAS